MTPQGHKVDADHLADFALYLGFEGQLTLGKIKELAIDEGLSADGFGGLMEPIGQACQGPAADAVNELFDFMQKKMCELGDGLLAAARQYGHDDEDNSSIFERTDGVYWTSAYKRYLPESEKKAYPS